ncbi:MAG: ATP-binding cassette domain-containing protein [Bacillota bacterium]
MSEFTTGDQRYAPTLEISGFCRGDLWSPALDKTIILAIFSWYLNTDPQKGVPMKLTANNISFHYHKDRPIFANLSFEMNEGDRIGIVAPSGSGKSTFANILCGDLKPHIGDVSLDGKNIDKINGFHPVQIVYQHPEKSLNPRLPMSKSLTEAYTPSLERQKIFGIKEQWLTRFPNELSSGELQRFCIVRLLTKEVKFLILDEISTMLDPITEVQIWTALLEIAKEQNLGLLVISHNVSLIHRVCEKTFDMQTGTTDFIQGKNG